MPLPLSTEMQERVTKVIKATKGKFFRIVFKKRTNGEERIMDCRTGVSKFVTGKGLKFNPVDYNLVSVWDSRAYETEEEGDTGYRFVPIENVKSIKCWGIENLFT